MYRTVLPESVNLLSAVEALADLSWPVLLESARFHAERGRYSYFTAAPVETWELPAVEYGTQPFTELRRALQETRPDKPVEGGPPFQGGIVGLLSYELGHCWERLPQVPADPFTTPPLVAGLYEWCLVRDHLRGETSLITPVNPRGTRQLPEHWRSLLERIEDVVAQSASPLDKADRESQESTEMSPPARFAGDGITRADYMQQAARVVEYIRAGDIYQANLSRKLHYPWPGSPWELYREIRRINPAPFAAYFRPSADWALVSASPEQFLQVEGDRVVTRPIKGTRRRWPAGELDLLQGAELQASEKDRAENTMIVDLLRNDLSRVCQIGSVRVPRWCELESFEKVHHLVSEVTGQLRTDADVWDLLAATFPGGSITGAPKIRAMEIIAELEQSARGAYCGSLFAAGWWGTLQSSILIRTLTWKQGWVQCPVGGGIVADSQPAEEYTETVHKSAGLIPPTPVST